MLSKTVVALAVVAGVLVLTKPTEAEIESKIRTAILNDINKAKMDANAEFLPNLLTLTCKFDADSCYKVIRAMLRVGYKDAIFFMAVAIREGNEPTRACVGTLKNLFCPAFLTKMVKKEGE